MLQGLLYFSLAKPDLESSELAGILSSARERNAADGITGQLHHENGLFLQFLEGPGPAIDALWGRIFLDERHSRITKMFAGPVSTRIFSSWDMQYSDGRDGYLLDYIRAKDISLKQRTLADASRLLRFLSDVTDTKRYRPIDDVNIIEATEQAKSYFVSRRKKSRKLAFAN